MSEITLESLYAELQELKKAKRARHRLKEIRTDEVSLVDRPANNKEFLMFKNMSTEPTDIDKRAEAIEKAVLNLGLTFREFFENQNQDEEISIDKMLENPAFRKFATHANAPDPMEWYSRITNSRMYG